MGITHWHSFNDKIYFVQIFQLRAGCKSFPNLGRFVLCYALFAHVFCEELVYLQLGLYSSLVVRLVLTCKSQAFID
jgi:hypothetical protein